MPKGQPVTATANYELLLTCLRGQTASVFNFADIAAVGRELGISENGVRKRLGKILAEAGNSGSARNSSTTTSSSSTPRRGRAAPRTSRENGRTQTTNNDPFSRVQGGRVQRSGGEVIPAMRRHNNQMNGNGKKTFGSQDLTGDDGDHLGEEDEPNGVGIGGSQESAIKVDSDGDDDGPHNSQSTRRSQRKSRTAIGTLPVIKDEDQMTEAGDIVVDDDSDSEALEPGGRINGVLEGGRRELADLARDANPVFRDWLGQIGGYRRARADTVADETF